MWVCVWCTVGFVLRDMGMFENNSTWGNVVTKKTLCESCPFGHVIGTTDPAVHCGPLLESPHCERPELIPPLPARSKCWFRAMREAPSVFQFTLTLPGGHQHA